MKQWDKIRKGNQDALYELYTDYYYPLYRKGMQQCGDTEMTRDAINQIFLELWEKRNSLKIRKVRSYLFRMLHNQIINEQRYQTRKNKLKLHASDVLEQQYELSYETLLIMSQRDEELKYRLRMAISNLTPRQMEMIKLKFFENLSYEQISKKTSLSIKSVYNTVYESIKQLRKAMKESW